MKAVRPIYAHTVGANMALLLVQAALAAPSPGGGSLMEVAMPELSVSLVEQAEVMEFGNWRSMFGKNYSGTELETRAAIFADTVQLIQKHNAEADAGLHTFRLGVTQFSVRYPQLLPPAATATAPPPCRPLAIFLPDRLPPRLSASGR